MVADSQLSRVEAERASVSKKVVKFADIQLAWFRSLVCVHKLGSYSKAAAYLSISQPTVTRHVQRLETWFGKKLLTNNVPPKLTPSGERAIHMIERVMLDICNFNMVIEKSIRGEKLNEQEVEAITALKITWHGI